jgi:hypothetical protein
MEKLDSMKIGNGQVAINPTENLSLKRSKSIFPLGGYRILPKVYHSIPTCSQN